MISLNKKKQNLVNMVKTQDYSLGESIKRVNSCIFDAGILHIIS